MRQGRFLQTRFNKVDREAMGSMPQMSVPAFVEKKKRGEKIAMLTAYDYTVAKLLEAAGVGRLAGGRQFGHGRSGS